MIVPIFDLDGTLLDSDAALAAAFVALGVAPADLTFGHVVVDECARLGVSVDAYLAAYDAAAARPYPGVEEMLGGLNRWAVCSNKHGPTARAELARLGWRPEVALFSDAFGGPKLLEPVLDVLGIAAAECVFVGDTEHDRACAQTVGAPFVVAGWNPRAAGLAGEAFLEHPSQLCELLA